MSKDWYQDIVDFNQEVMELELPIEPVGLDKEKRELWGNLIIEEVSELLHGMDKDDLREMADGGADAIVVILGTMVNAGIDLRPIWDEVHRTNMAKKGGEKRIDGKLLKPKGWKPPEIEKEIRRQQEGNLNGKEQQ